MSLEVKPKKCFFNGGEDHAHQTPIRNMHWSTWGGPVARGRGTYFYNMGYKAPVTFRLERRRAWEDGVLNYTRIVGTIHDPDRGPIHFRNRLI
jgi:hypothetical protein